MYTRSVLCCHDIAAIYLGDQFRFLDRNILHNGILTKLFVLLQMTSRNAVRKPLKTSLACSCLEYTKNSGVINDAATLFIQRLPPV